MKRFDKILRQELSKPVALKNGNGATIEPMEAMVKSVLNNAMKGDPHKVVTLATTTAAPSRAVATTKAGWSRNLRW